MSTELWGEFTEDEKPEEIEKMIPVGAKRLKLGEMLQKAPVASDKRVQVKVRNPLMTQTIEVMKQTEMLQSLIDTYANKSGTSNYLLNPCQMIPEVDFPPENAANFVSDDKFALPIWFVPPQETRFARGIPQTYPQINTDICRASLRKAVCGQLRVTGFTDTADSALVLFTGAIEEFVRNFMHHIREVHANDAEREMQNEIEVRSLEKAYYSLTNTSLTQVHNYFKHSLVARNRAEIAEFNGVLQEYDKLMKESQSMQKEEFQDGDFLNILEMPQSNEAASVSGVTMQDINTAAVGGATMLSILEGQTPMTSSAFGKHSDTTIMHDSHASTSASSADCVNPYTTESLLQTHD